MGYQMTREDIFDLYPDEEFMFADGYDDAIIGIDEEDLRVVYSISGCIDSLIEDGMTREEALEWYEYNTVRANPYMGDKRPIFLQDYLL